MRIIDDDICSSGFENFDLIEDIQLSSSILLGFVEIGVYTDESVWFSDLDLFYKIWHNVKG